MASSSSLRKRLSLVWISGRGDGMTTCSPIFFLDTSEWNLQISRASFYTHGYDYSITLHCCRLVKSIQPFEVVTYLEEKRGNAQMYCSKLTVSSRYETLFEGTYDATYEKLPSSKIYEDFTVVCTFYPSTVLALKPDVERVSNPLRIRPSLVWETGKPTTVKTESPVFGLQESCWKLFMYSENSTQSTSPVCKICLINCKGIAPSEPFEVKTFLEDKRSDDYIGCSKLIVSSSCENLYKASLDDIYKKIPGLKLYDDMRVVCKFDSFTESTLIV